MTPENQRDEEVSLNQIAINIVGKHWPTDPRRGLERAIEEALAKIQSEKSALEERVRELTTEKGMDRFYHTDGTYETLPYLQVVQMRKDAAKELTRLKAENEQYWALAKQHQEALKSSQKALGEMKLYHHNAKEEVHRLTASLAVAHEAIEQFDDLIRESKGVHGLHLNGDVAEWGWLYREWLSKLPFALSDPSGSVAFEKWKRMEAVVSESEKITNIAPPIYGCDLRGLKDALEALDGAKGKL